MQVTGKGRMGGGSPWELRYTKQIGPNDLLYIMSTVDSACKCKPSIRLTERGISLRLLLYRSFQTYIIITYCKKSRMLDNGTIWQTDSLILFALIGE